ncbi:MAG: PAS domain S-box protein, partial [Geobacter sp.]
MGRAIASRIGRLRDGAAVIGGGHLDYRIDIKGNDEFAELSGAFNVMSASLRGSYLALESEVADRKRAEDALRASEEKFRFFIAHSPVAVAMFDRDMRYIIASRRWLKDYGVEEQDITGRSHYEVFPEIPERWKEIHRRCLAGAIEKNEQDRFPRLDGSVDWLRWEVHPWHDRSGAIGGIIMFTEVITEQKRMEGELRQSEQRLNKAQEIAHLGSWELDVVNDLLTWSDEVYRIFGFEPREFGATYEAFLEAVHPDDRAAVDTAYTGSLREGRDTYEIEHRVVRKSTGEIRYVHEKCEHIRDEAGRILFSAGMVHDITERRLAEEALQKSKNELEIRVEERTKELEESRARLKTQYEELQHTYHELKEVTAERLQAMEELRERDRMMIQQSRMAAMGEMLGNIAHQWRQPLNILGLMIQDLGLSHECGEFSKELLQASIRKEMEIILHLSQTIDDFSNFAVPDKEKRQFRVEEVISKSLSLVQESFVSQCIKVETNTAQDLWINGYANEFSQVLLNILINARDAFLEQGTTNAQITVRSWLENGRAVVTITDNAGGVREDILGKIFDAYFTTKELGKGSGVGLFMSKTIIEKNMGGRLTARNVKGGAEFRIEV